MSQIAHFEFTNDFLSLGYVRQASAGTLKMPLNLEDAHSVRASQRPSTKQRPQKRYKWTKGRREKRERERD